MVQIDSWKYWSLNAYTISSVHVSLNFILFRQQSHPCTQKSVKHDQLHWPTILVIFGHLNFNDIIISIILYIEHFWDNLGRKLLDQVRNFGESVIVMLMSCHDPITTWTLSEQPVDTVNSGCSVWRVWNVLYFW